MDGKGGSAISSKPACQRSRDNVFGVTICLLSRAQSWFHWHVPFSSCPWNMNMRHRVFFPVRRTGYVTGFCPRSWIFYFFCPIQHRFRLLSGEWFPTEVGGLVYKFLECLLIRRHLTVESTARGPADSCRHIGPNASGEEDGGSSVSGTSAPAGPPRPIRFPRQSQINCPPAVQSDFRPAGEASRPNGSSKLFGSLPT